MKIDDITAMKTTNKELYLMWYREKQQRLDLQTEVRVLRDQIAVNNRRIKQLCAELKQYRETQQRLDFWK